MTTQRSLEGRNVWVLAKAFPPVIGGVETYSAEIAWEYARRGATVTVLTQTTGDARTEDLASDGVTLTLHNVGRGSQPVVLVKLIWLIWRLLRGGRPDLVHATTWRVGVGALMCLRVPRIVTVHGREVINGSALMLRVMRFVLSRTTVGVAVSPSTLRLVEAIVPRAELESRWVVAWNGITIPAAVATQSAPRPLSAGRDVELFTLCRLVPRKNVLRIVEALAIVKEDGITGFQLRIGGDGPLRAEIADAIARLGLHEHVRMLGRVPEEQLAAEYLRADVFVHPQSHTGDGNDFEGFGLVVADAMACGNLVVVGQAGGPADFVKDGVNGLVVDGDDLDAVAGALRAVCDRKVDSVALAAAGQRLAFDQFTWQRHVETILAGVS